jgi:hypothetical protein
MHVRSEGGQFGGVTGSDGFPERIPERNPERKKKNLPVLVAVSQATLERGSSAKQASRMASETWSL